MTNPLQGSGRSLERYTCNRPGGLLRVLTEAKKHPANNIANNTTGMSIRITSEDTPKEILINVKTNRNGKTCMTNARNTIASHSTAFKTLMTVKFILFPIFK